MKTARAAVHGAGRPLIRLRSVCCIALFYCALLKLFIYRTDSSPGGCGAQSYLSLLL